MGSGGPLMSSGADGSDPCTGLDPGTIPELPAHEPPVLQAPSPAPQQEVVVASQTEAPLPAVTIVISRPGEDVQMPDAKGGSPACSPQAGDGKPMATSVSLTASAAAKEAGLARSDSDSLDDYEQCRYPVGVGFPVQAQAILVNCELGRGRGCVLFWSVPILYGDLVTFSSCAFYPSMDYLRWLRAMLMQ